MSIPYTVREKAPDFNEKQLEDYVNRVHKLLSEMKPGDKLVIAKVTRESNRELFIECCKWYMRLHKEEYCNGIEFNSDFTVVKKYDHF